MLILACLPIGDARDASAHLIEAIGQVQYVAAEDSRKFARLCQELNIKHHAKVISFFEGNESEQLGKLIKSGNPFEHLLLGASSAYKNRRIEIASKAYLK